ncbi:triphosphoribosyl-dephospho-CoA synthase, partial [Nitratireductor sp. GCM10026969]|uniref:triphosphoribosyl-dephospho-CoA synthase n=1 Tax=Nitratireductor sp. GCM10026969 TaxID=3252645 RepID=UPI003615891D
ALARVLAGMDVADSAPVFEAIVLASPGGLGSAPSHDVREAPRVTVVEAMRAASDRDIIARQYATDFQDVFETGVAAHRKAEGRGLDGMWPTVFTYLAFLAGFPDSHVARKHGVPAAEALAREAAAVLSETERMHDEAARIGKLMDFDRRLKAQSLNPGTSADLTVATLFVRGLRSNLHN